MLGPSYDAITRDWASTEPLRLEDIKNNSKILSISDLAAGLDMTTKKFEEHAWQAAQCDKSDWTLENVPGREVVLGLRFAEPEDGYGKFAGGRIHALAVMLGEKSDLTLKDQGQKLHKLIGPIVESLTGSPLLGWVADAGALAIGWNQVVDKATKQIGGIQLEEDKKYQHDQVPVQRRQARLDLLLACFLLSISLAPLLKAIFTARSVTRASHKLPLALHGLLDMSVLIFTIWMASITLPARGAASAMNSGATVAIEEFSKPRIQEAFVGLAPLLKWCFTARKPNCLKELDEHFSHMPDHLRLDVKHRGGPAKFKEDQGMVLNEVYATLFGKAREVLDGFLVSNGQLALFGITVVAFILLSYYLANTMLRKVHFQKAAVLNVGFAGPFHLAACVP